MHKFWFDVFIGFLVTFLLFLAIRLVAALFRWWRSL